MMAIARHFIAIFAGLMVLFWPGAASAERVALIIANSQYASASALKNPSADARLIAQSLENIGFDSVETHFDLGKGALEQKLRAFGNRADGADVALIYFAGHGIEAGGQNYLIPTDAKLLRDRDLEVEATRMETALLMVQGAQLKILVLDACRNNPFAASMQRTLRNRAIGRGLAAIEPEGETLVVYAAKAGATAADGTGANSPFAEALSTRLQQPGLEISLLFRNVRDDVLDFTGGTQEPFTYGSLSGTAFYFVPAPALAAPAPATAPATAPVTGPVNGPARPVGDPGISAATNETLFWQGTVNANSENAYRSYLEQYPKGRFASLAQENIARITAPPVQLPGVNGLSIPAFSNVIGPNAVGGAGSSTPNEDILRSFAFKPSAELRRKNVTDFIAQSEKTNPASGAIVKLILQSQDIFALVDRELGQDYSMSVNNMADMFALMISTLHDAANGQVTEGTKEQALGLRNQMAKLMLLTPNQIPQSDAERQAISDQMVMASVVLGVTLDQLKSDPKQLQPISDEVHKQALQTMGINLREMVVTGNGLVPK